MIIDNAAASCINPEVYKNKQKQNKNKTKQKTKHKHKDKTKQTNTKQNKTKTKTKNTTKQNSSSSNNNNNKTTPLYRPKRAHAWWHKMVISQGDLKHVWVYVCTHHAHDFINKHNFTQHDTHPTFTPSNDIKFLHLVYQLTWSFTQGSFTFPYIILLIFSIFGL